MRDCFHEYQSLLQEAGRLIEEQRYTEPFLLVSPESHLFFKRESPAPVKKKKDIIVPTPVMKTQRPSPIPPVPKPAEVKQESHVDTIPVPKNEKKEDELFKTFQQFSAMTLKETIPDDAIAKDVATRWKNPQKTAEVVLLAFAQNSTEMNFLTNLAKAIDARLKSTLVIDALKIEKDRSWDRWITSEGLKWIIAPAKALEELPLLKSHLREKPATSERFLGKIPLLLLPALSSYLKNPSLKKSLWQSLCQTLKD